jgi:hypothetical protein
MYKILDIYNCNGFASGGLEHLSPETYKTARDAAEAIKEMLDDMQRQLNEDAVDVGEKKWYWKRHSYDFSAKQPWWSDGKNIIMAVKLPKYQ